MKQVFSFTSRNHSFRSEEIFSDKLTCAWWKHGSNVWNLFKVNNTDTKTMPVKFDICKMWKPLFIRSICFVLVTNFALMTTTLAKILKFSKRAFRLTNLTSGKWFYKTLWKEQIIATEPPINYGKKETFPSLSTNSFHKSIGKNLRLHHVSFALCEELGLFFPENVVKYKLSPNAASHLMPVIQTNIWNS